MNELSKALNDIAAIRTQIARDTAFRGYGPVTVAATGLLAIAAATLQGLYLLDPMANAPTYVAIWVATAACAIALVGAEMIARSRRIHCGLADEMIHAATEQLIPAGVAGALLTVVLFRFAPDTLWMLPGLWQIIFSLGFLASCRSLPRPMYAVGVWYLAAGLAVLSLANGEQSLSPWAMAIPFGLGQLAMAAILQRCAGDHHVED